MIKTIPVEKLKVGMYVNLSGGWLSHPFPKAQFIIKSQAQIKKLAASGIKQISVDTEKSRLVADSFAMKQARNASSAPADPDPMELILNDLRQEMDDEQLEPIEKAEVVYSSSIDMMKNLLEHPTVPNIKKSKMIISVVVNHLLDESEANRTLMKVLATDYHTYTHSVNVGVLSVLLAKEIFEGTRGLTSASMLELGTGCFFHDLGKYKVAGSIFDKKGKLTIEELRQMRLHPAHGHEMLHRAKQLSIESKFIVLQHHERADGRGYPLGLKGKEIHYFAHLCSVVDVYEALTSQRPYKKSLSTFEALKIMKEEMVTHDNRELFRALVSLLGH